MGKAPAFQFYPADFLADENVVLMTNQEVGCYIKLLCYCWRQKSIPMDVSRIAKLCGESSGDMEKMWPAIEPCFNVNGTRYFNKRLDIERRKQAGWRKKCVSGGKRSAKNRADLLKGSSARGGKGSSTLQSSSSSSSSSSLSSEVIKPGGLPSEEIIKEGSIPKVLEELESLCNDLYDKKIFPKVHAWKNKMLKEKTNPRALCHCLIRCGIKKPDEPWAYCTKIIKVENGNYNETDNLRTA